MMIKPSVYLYLLNVFFVTCQFLLSSCNGKTSSKQEEVVTDTSSILLADPTIFVHEGMYYLYGTDGEQPDQGFKVYRSENLEDWQGPLGIHDGFALVKDEVFGDRGFWAPQVWFENGMFYMAYTANENIAIATSDSPLGPFTQKNNIPVIAEGKQIDPFIFTDTDGKRYLYHVRLKEGNRIFVAALRDNYSGIDSSTVKECLHAALPWENTEQAEWPVVEGPTVVKEGGQYYMFYSANDFRNPDYAVGIAVADNVYGPWRKLGDKPLLSRQHSTWSGTGHGDVFKADGEWYYVCHTHFSDDKVGPRRTALVPFTMDSGTDPENPATFDTEQFRLLHKQP